MAELFTSAGLHPHIALSTWDDYAIMAMVEAGLGLAILPSLILKRIPYHLELRPLKPRANRRLCFATKAGAQPSIALAHFREYVIKDGMGNDA